MKTLSGAADLTIGALADRTGCTVPTIRYYEEIGLIPTARRRPSGHRYYDAEAEARLNFIRRCRDFGFSIDQVRELSALADNHERDCVETRDIALAHLDTVREKLAELRVLESNLSRFVQLCSDTCAGGPAAKCTISRDLRAVKVSTDTKRTCCG